MRVLWQILVLCSVIAAFAAGAADKALQFPAEELPAELPVQNSDLEDFPLDESRRIVEDPALPAPLDHPVMRRQGHSLIPWKDLKQEEFLSIRRWIAERAERDKDPMWKVKKRLNASPEQVGRVISCVGTCILHRGTVPNSLRWLSRINEGDEIKTEADSYLWMMLTDGTLVRMAPHTSLTLMEANITAEKFFYHARVNAGLIHWRPRTGRLIKTNLLTETDRLFLPVMDREANIEFFQRQKFQGKSESEKIALQSERTILGHGEQRAEINRLIGENNRFAKLGHSAMIVTPNATLNVENLPVSLYFWANGKTYAKAYGADDLEEGSSVLPEGKLSLALRGFTNTDLASPALDAWFEVAPDGKYFETLSEPPQLLMASEILYKRIPTLLLVREKWMGATAGLWDDVNNSEKLAVNWGHRLWGSEHAKREEFLAEYTRRVETSHLRALERVAKEKPVEFDGRFFARGLDRYFMDIKRRYSFGQNSVLEMIPLHYYGWVLINAKQL